MRLLKSTFEKNFVQHTMMIALPIMLQNGITNFVNMLDNIMVGRVGTDPMTGVSIVNSLLFRFWRAVGNRYFYGPVLRQRG